LYLSVESIGKISWDPDNRVIAETVQHKELKMSTLVTTHDGLERVVRGGHALGNLAGRRPEGALRSKAGTLFARMIERLRQHRQDRIFEQLMHDDPRVYAEVQAAATRAEWR